MEFEKIWSGRIDSAIAGASLKIATPGRGGGRKCKVAQVMVKVLAASSTNAAIAADFEHGPDGTVFTKHSTAIVSTTLASLSGTYPYLLVGDASTSVILGEYLRLSIELKDGVAGVIQWAQIEIYEMRKPY